MTPQSDIYLCIGILLVAIALPIVLAGLVERKLAFFSLLFSALGAGLLWFALHDFPGGFSISEDWREIPDAIIRVIGLIIN